MSLQFALYVVRIFARDWQRCADFYQQVLELPLEFRDDSMGWAQFDAGGANLAVERLVPEDEESETLCGRFVGVSLHTPDIDAAYRLLTDRGVHFVSPPAMQPWGGMLAHFEDPEGNVLTLLGDPQGEIDG